MLGIVILSMMSGKVEKKSLSGISKEQEILDRNKDKYSKLKLKYKLMEKGIDKEIIENALEVFSIDEVSMIRKLLDKKNYFELDEAEKKQKVIASIMRQGFKYQKIKDVTNDTCIG